VGHRLRDKESHVLVVGSRVKEGLRAMSRPVLCKRIKKPLPQKGSFCRIRRIVRLDMVAISRLIDTSSMRALTGQAVCFTFCPMQRLLSRWSQTGPKYRQIRHMSETAASHSKFSASSRTHSNQIVSKYGVRNDYLTQKSRLGAGS
jgi:hypothetical protein